LYSQTALNSGKMKHLRNRSDILVRPEPSEARSLAARHRQRAALIEDACQSRVIVTKVRRRYGRVPRLIGIVKRDARIAKNLSSRSRMALLPFDPTEAPELADRAT
jgi:hypothetical protein